MANELDGIALGAIALGGAFIWSGIKGKSILQVVQNTIQGKSSASTPAANAIGLPADTSTSSSGQSNFVDAPLSGGSKRAQVINLLEGSISNKNAVAGIAGNIQVESGFSPTALNAGEGAIGLCQWELGRRTNLQAFAKLRGKTEADLATQVAFIFYEGVPAGVLSATSPADAASIFDEQYERSAGTSRSARISAAESIYKTL